MLVAVRLRDKRLIKRRAALAVLPIALGLAGCGTVNSYADGCPAPFSGVRTDREYLRDVRTFDGGALRWVMVTGDLPLSALADTLTLPIGAWARQAPPAPVSPGCRWAIPHR